MAEHFCLDTSFLINGWNKHYSQRVFPSLWGAIDRLIGESRVCSCEEVYLELSKQDDKLFEWAKTRRSAFHAPTAETIREFKKIMAEHRNFAAASGTTNRADPWVIAHAKTIDAIVVTDEASDPKRRPTKPPKIPDVCDKLGVPCVTPIEFLARAGLRF